MYTHAPTNNDYLTIFVRGWLADRKEKDGNWALYVYDCNHEQMKCVTRPLV